MVHRSYFRRDSGRNGMGGSGDVLKRDAKMGELNAKEVVGYVHSKATCGVVESVAIWRIKVPPLLLPAG